MQRHIWGADKDVIQVDEGVGDVQQEAVHQALKRLCRILQPEWHEEILIQAKRGDDGTLWHIRVRNWYLMLALEEIQVAEHLATRQLGAQVLHVGQGVPVWGGDVVEVPVL